MQSGMTYMPMHTCEVYVVVDAHAQTGLPDFTIAELPSVYDISLIIINCNKPVSYSNKS